MNKIYGLDENQIVEIMAAGIRCWYASVFPNGSEQQKQRDWHLGKAFAYFYVLENLSLLKIMKIALGKTEASIVFNKEFMDKVLTPGSTPQMSQQLIADMKTKMNYADFPDKGYSALSTK